MAVFRPRGNFGNYPGGTHQVIPTRGESNQRSFGPIPFPMDWYDRRKNEFWSYHEDGLVGGFGSRLPNVGKYRGPIIPKHVPRKVPETPKPPAPSEPPKQMRLSELSDNYMPEYILEQLREQFPATFTRYQKGVDWTYYTINGRRRKVGRVPLSFFVRELGLEPDTKGYADLRNGIIYVLKGLNPFKEYAIVRHEDTHLLYPHLSEGAVHDLGIVGALQDGNFLGADYLSLAKDTDPRRARIFH